MASNNLLVIIIISKPYRLIIFEVGYSEIRHKKISINLKSGIKRFELIHKNIGS